MVAAIPPINSTIANDSSLEEWRKLYTPRLPPVLLAAFQMKFLSKTSAAGDKEMIRKLFPNLYGMKAVSIVPNEDGPILVGQRLNIGVVLDGGPAPGTTNVISGLLDFVRSRNVESKIIGFLGGPTGILEDNWKLLDVETVAGHRNLAGNEIIGLGRAKIDSPETLEKAKQAVEKLQLDGLVVVGGDDPMTNAAQLAEYFITEKVKTKVIGVPKTIDGDLQNEYIDISTGFDTATKLYSSLVANLAADAKSAKKLYHFCRVMGRDASHVTLECALQTHPNITIISEEVGANQQNLKDVVLEVADVITARASKGMQYGFVVVPEGLLSFVSDVGKLIEEMDAVYQPTATVSEVSARLSPESAALFATFPEFIQRQFLLERDPHGRLQSAKIETERLIVYLVAEELDKRKAAGTYKGSFQAQSHFFGYEGRAGLPSNFDANLCYSLGYTAAALIEGGQTGMVATARNLTAPVEEWTVGGMPLTHMMSIEHRSGQDRPVIRSVCVDLHGPVFKVFQSFREQWKLVDDFRDPGAIQFYGPLSDAINFSLQIRLSKPMHYMRH